MINQILPFNDLFLMRLKYQRKYGIWFRRLRVDVERLKSIC